MGILASCESCACLDELKKPKKKYNADESSSDTETDTDEQQPLVDSSKKKHKKRGKNKFHKDESYFSSSDDDTMHQKKKNKKDKPSKKQVADIQQEIMQKSKNEMDRHNALAGIKNNAELYGMDVKTMELLMNVNINIGSPTQPPQPTLPSISSQPIASISSAEYNDAPSHLSIDPAHDMSTQLQNYTSTIMYDENAATPITKEDEYNALTINDDDNTPALPHNLNNNNNNKTQDRIKKALGGLDYDFDEHLDDDMDIPSTELEKQNTLHEKEKDISDLRIRKTLLKANVSRGEKEIEKLIKEQYEAKHHEDELTDDSSYEEHEKEEIERRKTEVIINNKNASPRAKLFRKGTASAWDHDDIHDMHLAMTKEMEAIMQRQNSKDSQTQKTPNSKYEMEQDMEWDSEQNIEEEYDMVNNDDIDNQIKIAPKTPVKGDGTKQSQLFRHKSAYKWDRQRLDQENKDMQAHLADMMIAHQGSID